jgi:hypothetical protein
MIEIQKYQLAALESEKKFMRLKISQRSLTRD